ncbi:MAG: AAA family ATPase [Eubacterium sp.]|nr:AAA family ATPase [Eubacterium sp.]
MIEINGKTSILGVIGDPIEHTLSPVIHNTLCELTGVNAAYLPIHVENAETDGESNIASAVKGLYASGVKGLNVTVPYKQEVMKSLVEVDSLAAEIGAVNTLVPSKTGKGYKGYNTDMPGLRRALESKGVILEGKKAVIIGAGGAARAVCVMLEKAGVEKIYLLNRTKEKAEKIASEISCITPLGLSEYKDIPVDKYIFFQCTSFGLKDTDGLVIDDDDFYKMAEYGYDLIYNPAVTPFIAKLDSLGVRSDNGLSMLLYQGIIAFEYWFDTKISGEDARLTYARLCQKLYGDNIILVGYMGSGKTTIGKALAERRGMSFIDLDAYIVEREGRTINQIFAEDGEEKFREIETFAIDSIRFMHNTVVSTGGGAVLRTANRNLLKDCGRIYYLQADVDTIYERVKDDTARPLLNGLSEEEKKAKISEMLKQREVYYKTTSDVAINTSGKTVDEIVNFFSITE